MPEPNNTNAGDGHNIEGFQGQVSLPTTSKFLVGRIDHDFGDKFRFFGSYRYYALSTSDDESDRHRRSSAGRQARRSHIQSAASAETRFPGGRTDYHNQPYINQRLPHQQHADLVAMGYLRGASATGWIGWCA